jgi:hypothetical protein
MSAPVSLTDPGSIAFTVAAVPTGINAGVLISPRAVVIVPSLALPEVELSVKENFSAITTKCFNTRLGSSLQNNILKLKNNHQK